MTLNKNFLAVDLGASHGRVILGKFDGKKLKLELIHDFKNRGVNLNGSLYWDVLKLFSEIKIGLKKAAESFNLNSIGIDTWGVDYALLDRRGELLSNPYHYRDQRTDNIMAEVYNKIPKAEIYQKTGNQFLQLNTLFQLYADKLRRPWLLENAADLLFMPDLINYFLTGKKYNEHSIASTSQLFNPRTNSWEEDIFKSLDLNINLMQKIIYPGTKIGDLLNNIKSELNIKLKLPVVAVGSHDTASAVAAAPILAKNSAYISSGTWSLLGMELEKPIINQQGLNNNFTNEIGLESKIRFLKNLTGLWLIQESKRIWNRDNQDLTYSEITEAAEKAESYLFKIDPDHHDFLNPENMLEAVKNYCRKTNQYVPSTLSEIARGIYESLAFKYAEEINKLEEITNQKIDYINIVGGGSRAELVCQFTADLSQKVVIAGPVEAAAAGNILAQMMAAGEIKDLKEGRELIKNSFELKKYYPKS
jgi:rhamnulokinase